MIPVGTFGLEVTLLKMIDRKGDQTQASTNLAAKRTVDLTPYLGDSTSIRLTKDIREPAGGFVFTFYDQMDPDTLDTVASLLEPQDIVEIRASHQPQLYSRTKLPLLMRGFVSRVQRRESFAEDGTPERSVVVAGQDFGKLWIIHSVFTELALATEKLMLSTFQLNAALGIDAKVYNIADFVRTMTTAIMNPKIQALSVIAQQQIAPFDVSLIGTVEGSLIPSVAGVMQPGPLWSIMEGFADRPWNELFIQDAETGPQMVFREAPLKDINGNLIMPNATDPGTFEVAAEDVLSLTVSRSDERVANFFWVPPGSSSLDSNNFVTVGEIVNGELGSPDSLLDLNHGNNDPSLYGSRRMVAGSILIPDAISEQVTDQSASARKTASDNYVVWYLKRASQLKAMNRDNVVFEDAALEVWGSERFKPGQYVRFTRGSLVSEGYVTRVSHIITPLSSWISHLTVERMTGYLVRRKADKPYLAEGRDGPYQ